MFVDFDDVIEGYSAHWAALTTRGTSHASEIVPARDEGRIPISFIADFAQLVALGDCCS